MDTKEKHFMTGFFNKREYLRDKCIPDLLWEQTKTQPHNVSVIDGVNSLTYRERFENSLNFAMYLQHLGASSDDCIGIFIEPSLELMVG